MTEVGLRPAVDGHVRGPGDERYGLGVGEEAPFPITKQGDEENHAVLGQAADRDQQLRHRQSRQVRKGDPLAVAAQVPGCGRFQIPIDLRCAGDHDHLLYARINLERGLERCDLIAACPQEGDPVGSGDRPS